MLHKTQELRKNFTGQPDHVINFFVFIANEVRELMSNLGFKSFNEMIGQRKYLNFNYANDHWKVNNLDLSQLIYNIKPDIGINIYNCEKQDHGLNKILDRKNITRLKKIN